MKEVILLNYNEDINKIAKEERTKFLYNLLEKIGLDVSELSEDFFSVEERIKLRNLLTKYGVQVIEDNDGPLRIFVEKTYVGEWRQPTYKLKKDLSILDKKRQLYIEMILDYNHIFEGLEQQ